MSSTVEKIGTERERLHSEVLTLWVPATSRVTGKFDQMFQDYPALDSPH
jgi:hypothetical protein